MRRRVKLLTLGIAALVVLCAMFFSEMVLSGLTLTSSFLVALAGYLDALSIFLSRMMPWIPWSVIFTLVGSMLLVIVLVAVFKRLSRDTCLTEFENYHATVITPDETGDDIAEGFFGRLSVPAAEGGGFEVYYDPVQVENLEELLDYLNRVRQKTGEEKFVESIKQIEKTLGRHPTLTRVGEHHVDYVEASKKVYSSDLENVLVILRLDDDLSEEEEKRRVEDFSRFFHPGFLRRKGRQLRCALNTVRDKLNQMAVAVIGALSSITPAPKEAVDELTKKVKTMPLGNYEALLENSLGKVVNVQITDHLGQKDIQHAVLKEYTSKFLTLYQAKYPLRKVVSLSPEDGKQRIKYQTMDLHGKTWEKPNLKINTSLKGKREIENVTDETIHILNESSPVLLQPGEKVEIEQRDKIEYEITADVDIVIPRERGRVLGLGEPSYD